MSQYHRSYDFLWLGLALCPLLIIAVLLPIHPHDYWWYLRLGKDVLENGAVPIVDTYSSLQAGQPIVYQSWLSAVLFWLIYKTGGIPLTLFFVALVIVLTYALLWMLIRQQGIGPRLTTVLTLLAGLSGSNNWGVRPQLFTYLLFLVVLWILLRWQQQQTQTIWLLVAVSLLWTNLHGSFVLFFILTGLAISFGNGNKKTLLLVILASLVVTLINPRGLVLWQSVIGTFLSPGIRDLSPEWLPPLNQGWQMNLFFAWLLLLVPVAALGRNRMPVFHWMLFLSFSWLAVTGLRYVIWDLFVLPLVTAFLMPDFIVKTLDKTPEVKFPALNFGLGMAFLIVPFMLTHGVREEWWRGSPPALGPETPVAAVEWLNEHPEISGQMWNEVIFGSYLIYALPSRPVWLDTRIQVIFTAEQAEKYLFVDSARPGWDDFLMNEGVNLLVLAQTQPTLIQAVEQSSQWCRQYQDDVAVIFARCSFP
jgi:hypothetical protein